MATLAGNIAAGLVAALNGVELTLMVDGRGMKAYLRANSKNEYRLESLR